MFKRFASNQSRSQRRARLPWALLALPGLAAACGDDGTSVIIVPTDAGPDAAATPEPRTTESQTSGPQSPASSGTEEEATTGAAPATEAESTDDRDPTSEEAATSAPALTTDGPVGMTSEPDPATSAPDGNESTNDVDTSEIPGVDSTFAAWTDAGASSTEPGDVGDAGVSDSGTVTEPPQEYPCGLPIGMSEGVDAGGPGEWPNDTVDGGVFDDGLLVNGAFDFGIEGWTSQVNPYGIDAESTFVWESEGRRVISGYPYMPNAQAFYQDFTVPSGAISSAVFAFDVWVMAYYSYYAACLQDVETLEPWYLTPHDAFRVDIVAADGAVFGDAGVVTADAGIIGVEGDAGVLVSDAGALAVNDAGGLPASADAGLGGGDGGSPMSGDGGGVPGDIGVFTTPILFTLFAPQTTTYGVQHIVVDGEALATFLDAHRGETLRLRFGVVSSSFPVMGLFDNVSLSVEM